MREPVWSEKTTLEETEAFGSFPREERQFIRPELLAHIKRHWHWDGLLYQWVKPPAPASQPRVMAGEYPPVYDASGRQTGICGVE